MIADMASEMYTIEVRGEDVATLEAEAHEAFRDPTNHASAMLQAALRAKRSRPKGSTGRRVQRTNGIARVHVGSVDSD